MGSFEAFEGSGVEVDNQVDDQVVERPPMMANVSFGTVCNLRCPYCFNRFAPADTEMPEERALMVADTLNLAARVRRVRHVMAVGGELTCWRALPAFMDRLECGDELELFTNGLDLRRLVEVVGLSTGRVLRLVISVHDGAYRDLGRLDEHLRVWEDLATRPDVVVQYRVLFDGARTAGYLPMIDRLVDTVPADRPIDFFCVRGHAATSSEPTMLNAIWIRRNAPRYLERFMRSSWHDMCERCPVYGQPCPVSGHWLSFGLRDVRGPHMCGCGDAGRLMYDEATPERIVEELVLNPPRVTCGERFVPCMCGLKYAALRGLVDREAWAAAAVDGDPYVHRH